MSGTARIGEGNLRNIKGVLDTGTYQYNDNLLFYPAETADNYFDDGGVSFVLQNGVEINLYNAMERICCA